MEKNTRKVYIEYLRCIAMFMVVMVHICTTARTDFALHTTSEDVLMKSITNVGHFAVPVFFMITGALFLNPEKTITISQLLKKYTLKYALAILIFGWIFAALESVFDGERDILRLAGKSFVMMIEGKTWNHMWYLYTLVGIMLSMPIWRMVTEYCKRTDNKAMLKYIVTIICIFTSIIPLFSRISGIQVGVTFPVGVIYVGYLFLGYMIDNDMLDININACIVAAVISAIAIVLSVYLNIACKISCLYSIGEYVSPVIMVLAVSIFIMAKKICMKNNVVIKGNVVPFVSKCSYGVYIVHMAVINVAYKFLKINPFGTGMLLKILILWACVSIFSLVLVTIGQHIPGIKKLI